MKRILSFMLILCVLMSCIIAGDYTSVKTEAATTFIDYGLVDNVQYGQILHCWNWSFDNIRKNMQLIASQGFTAVQTSPIQSSKESTRESWSSVQNSAWVYYQPISFNIEQNSWNALGTKTQFEAMCKEAHKYGVKVIVDAVFNHMANDSSENTINPQISSDLRDDKNCWYSITWNTSNWEDRYDVTHNCLSGFPDLNTSNPKVQNYAIGFLKECIDAGADGFRFDAVKHIETPADAYGTASDFWPNVLGTATYHAQQTRGITPYYYGELLGSPGGGLSVTAYTDHMSVTDNNTGNCVRDAIASGNASGACLPHISNGAAPDKAVQWNESHDTYYADNNSIWISNENMKKTWAIVGTRAQVCGLYLARPENNTTTMLGDGDITAWADKEVKAINRFKNYFAGHPEYLASSGNIVYNERGNTGVVLVNASGGKASVSVPAHRMYDGVYTDAITGKHFSVSNGTISGEIGDSGIAVVYSYPSTVHVSEDSQAFRGDTLDVTLTYNEATSGTYSIDGDYAKSYTSGDVISVGCGTKYGDETELLVTASGGTTTDSVIKTYKKLHPDTELTMYFDNSSKKWSTVYAYVYNLDGDENAKWPGVEMAYDSTLGLYKYDVPKGFETSKVVFNDSDGNQTPSSGGHSFNAYTSKYKDGSFYGYNTGVEGKLYFEPSEDWLSDNARFAVYVWNDSGNTWVNLKDTDSDGIYEAQLPQGVFTECIFARMDPSTSSNNFDNVWNKTGDMGISNNHNYFKIADGWNTSDGTWSIIDVSVVGTNTDAYLSGSFNAWSKTKTPFKYTDYNKAVTSVDLPAGTYTFKMYKNDEWFGNPGTINNTTAGNGWRMCKNESKNCTLVASGGTYTFTLDTETLKITVDYEAKEVDQIETFPSTEESTEKDTEESTVSSVSKGYYVVGTINGEDKWGVETLSEDRLLKENPAVSGEYMLDYTFKLNDAIKVAYFDGSSITKWYNSTGDNYTIGEAKVGDCTVYFRPEGNSAWTYNYFTVIPKTVEETASAGYYIVGTLNGEDKWGVETLSEDRLLKENPAVSGEYMLDYTFTEGDEIKVVHFDGTDFTRWYNSSGDNYSIGSSKKGEGTIYFRPDGNSDWSYYYFTVIPKTVDETESTEEETEPTEKETEPTEVQKPVKVENIVATPSSSTAVLSWDAVEGATKYWVYKNVSGSYVIYSS
ncbi:MAG: starch-binding protein, partial [Ruminococcus sp.]|nr:starch-binding protein [Ruminococcus sp.]